jgi:hypothetical protein
MLVHYDDAQTNCLLHRDLELVRIKLAKAFPVVPSAASSNARNSSLNSLVASINRTQMDNCYFVDLSVVSSTRNAKCPLALNLSTSLSSICFPRMEMISILNGWRSIFSFVVDWQGFLD